VENRRDGSPLGGVVGVRVSSNIFDPCNVEQDKRGEVGDRSNRAMLAESGMVSRSAGLVNRRSSTATNVAVNVTSASHECIPPATSGVESSRLEIIKRDLRERGFSGQVADAISQSNRRSTSNLYQYKWDVFVGWCKQREIDPRGVTLGDVAEFLLFLFEEKKFSISTVKGYRSALSRVLNSDALDVTGDRDLSALIRSLELRRPAIPRRAPRWDLSLVLTSLTKAPYEPMAAASLRNVTLKTVFLVSLGTAKRVSEVHALSAEVNHSSDWSHLVLTFDPEFIAKNQIPGDPSTSLGDVTLPALAPSVERGLPDRLLCPVRALRHYLDVTRGLRQGRRRLFISFQEGRTSEISQASISSWIKAVIRYAYQTADSQVAALHSTSVHELRALATSLRFQQTLSLKSVMDAATWRGTSTFASFYLRDVSLHHGELSSLGPIVAAQSVISSSSH
jgi:hypothetical protein